MNEEFTWGVIGFAVIVSLIVGVMFLFPMYTRGQRLLNENNQTQVNDIMIAQTEQLVKVQKQKAQIKIEEAKGIAEAQRIINGTLTPLYLQHEAIEAQIANAAGNNHTVVYIPSGNNGIPLVGTVPTQ